MKNQSMTAAIETPEAMAETIEFQARSALADLGDNVPRDWIDGVVSLQAMVKPAEFSRMGWDQLCSDAYRFLIECGDQAASLGWSTREIFGSDGASPLNKGLVASLAGGKVVVITDDSATILSVAGTSHGFDRTSHGGGSSLLWNLAEIDTGGER